MESRLKKVADAEHHTTKYGVFQITIYFDETNNKEHIVLVKGKVADQEKVLCRVASECITGMALDSADCDCKEQMDMFMQMLNDSDNGILLLLRQEGRGHGITTKIRALANKNNGIDTIEAVEMLGLESDVRDYSVAVDILKQEKVRSISLATNNPAKLSAFDKTGISVIQRIPLVAPETDRTRLHLRAKGRHGHLI